MILTYFRMFLAAMIPPLLVGITYYVDTRTDFKKLSYMTKQVIIGVIFGLGAIAGTEWGIPINGAVINCRDAASLAAGLIFGGPAGIIAGLIGGIERWFASYWGAGYYTRIACSLATCLSGFFAGFMRHFIYEKKTPDILRAAFTAVVMEVVHLTLVFFTNINDVASAIVVVRSHTAWMIIINGFSLAVCSVVVAFMDEGVSIFKPRKWKDIQLFEAIQAGLIITLALSTVLITVFVYMIRQNQAVNETKKLMDNAIVDVSEDVSDAADYFLLKIAELTAVDVNEAEDPTDTEFLIGLTDHYNIKEVVVVDADGIVIGSSNEADVGYNMADGEQSAEFLCLLDGTETEFIQRYMAKSNEPNVNMKYVGHVLENGGFVQVGYDADGFQSAVDYEINGVVSNRHVGSEGFLVIADKNGKIISATDEFDLNLIEDDFSVKDYDQEVMYTTKLDDNKSYMFEYSRIKGYYIFAIYSKQAAMTGRDISVYITIFMLVLTFALIYCVLYLMLKRLVLKPTIKVEESLEDISQGKLDQKINVRSSKEFDSLSNYINTTVDTLKRFIAEEAARIDAELEFAKRIQASSLPKAGGVFKHSDDFELYATMDPAKEVGGDFYDFYMSDANRVNFMIADVSGKGIPAAMFMMRARSLLRNLTEQGRSVDRVFTEGNNQLCSGNEAEMFVTAWQGCLDLTTGVVKYANAGHNPPVVRHADGSTEFVPKAKNLVLAVMEDMPYTERELKLVPGDIIYLYTDGVTEATNGNQELYGEERLLDFLSRTDIDDMKQLCLAVKADVDAFVGDVEQFDDITMVAVKYNGK